MARGSFRQPGRICKPRREAFVRAGILASCDDSALAEYGVIAVS